MSSIGPFAIPILAVGAFAATLGWFGYQHMASPVVGPEQPATAQPAAVESTPKAPVGPVASGSARQDGDRDGGKPAQPVRANGGQGGAPAETAIIAPAFDVVRVEPTGETVVAGRASPGASVELVLNGVRHSRVVADPSGLFAIVPEALPPGSHELSLQITNADGTRVRSQQSVTVVVAANRQDAPLVTITTPGQPAVVLSRPDGGTSVAGVEPGKAALAEPGKPGPAPEGAKPAAEAPAPAKARRSIQIGSVETEGAGRLLVSGNAAPAAVVRLYLNDTFIAPASAGGDGRVSFAIERGMQPGSYKVRLDDVDPVSGQVRSRAEVPFEMPRQVMASASTGPGMAGTVADAEPATPGQAGGTRIASAGAPASPSGGRTEPAGGTTAPSVVVPEINTAVVSRGDSLWAISKRTYGHGLRYSVIYGANSKQIRDPNLIYPGQLFVLPVSGAEVSR